jgi:hypothetical protein
MGSSRTFSTVAIAMGPLTVALAAVAAPRIPQAVRGRHSPTTAMGAMVVTEIRSGTACGTGLNHSAVAEDAVVVVAAGAVVVVADGTMEVLPMLILGRKCPTKAFLPIQRPRPGTCHPSHTPTRRRHPQ